MSSLSKYNEKRNFNKTREPKGKIAKQSKRLSFCVQHHMARREHYDFRLEINDTLMSFAIPKGPSYDTSTKRLAVHVEDHPLSYKNFEGTIPKGEYGGGTVMLWDRGYYKFNEDYKKTIEKGYLKFTLYGKRLKGAWTLIHIKNDNWILIKEKDGIKLYDDINDFNTSIKSGKTMDEISGINKIELTNPDKIMFKDTKVTKKDLYNYYEKIAPLMLPYIQNRIISTVRIPKGVGGDKFFKKHFSENKYMKKIKGTEFYYIDTTNALLEEVQMNGIEFHINNAFITDKSHPNLLIFDLDPDELLPLESLRQGTRYLKDVLDKLKLKSYLKTSGGKGYHVVVPLDSNVTWIKLKKIAKDIVSLLENNYPDLFTSSIKLKDRKNKIFIDYLRNNKNASCVAPYSIRARDGAKVSMPIKWSDLDKIEPSGVDINLALKMVKRKNPWNY